MRRRLSRDPSGPVARRSTAQNLIVDQATSTRLARVRQQDTAAEHEVRSLLHHHGFRFRKRNRDLPGSPDVANRSRRWALFVHGCFWHHHNGCARATVPKRNRLFWLAKFSANRQRDRKRLLELRLLGYRCIVVWECEIEDSPRKVARRVIAALGSLRKDGRVGGRSPAAG